MHSSPETYLFAAGGPLRRIETQMHITRSDPRDWLRRAGAAALIAYVPALVFGILWHTATGEWPELLQRWAMHVRWLGAAPLLFLAEQLTERRALTALIYLQESDLIPAGERTAYRRALARAEHRRNAPGAELALAALALASALSDVWGFVALPPPHWWSGLISVALFRFLLLRWLWRWLQWGLFLQRLSRLRLRLSTLHPDQLGGLGPLAGPSLAFCCAIFAASVAIAAGIADRMASEGLRTAAFHPVVLAFGSLSWAIAAAPMWVFSAALYETRRVGLGRYGALATRYCRAFEARWFAATGGHALGSPDLQSLADLGGSYDIAARIQVIAVSRRLIAGVAAAVLVPMLPLVLTEVRFMDLVAAALRALL